METHYKIVKSKIFIKTHPVLVVLVSNLIQSSIVYIIIGYSFSLTWVKSKDGEEFELLYRVLSLGTLERVALEWMMDEIMFSTSMCPIFFERISRVIK